MALARWNGVVQDAAGNAVSGASIEVRDEATGFLARLFSDPDGTIGLGNPYIADGPEIAFHARGGNYRVKATKGAEEKTWRWVAIGTAQALDADQIATYLQAGIVPVQTRDELEDYAPAIPAPGEPETPLGGVVYADPNPALNGYYTYNFTTSEWDYARPLSDTLAGLSVVSVDDNEISAAASPGVNPAGVKAFYLDLDDWENTGPVTIRIDGAAAIPVVDVTGGEFLPGFATGRLFLSNEGSSLRMIVGGDYMAAVTAAIDAAIRAEAAAAGLNLPTIQPGDERKQLYVKTDLSGYELDKPARGGGELFKTVADMLADDNVVVGYEGSGAEVEVAPGDIVTAQGFRYEVAASDATDNHLVTAGGVKLRVLPDVAGWMSIVAFGARVDNTTDDTAAYNAALATHGNVRGAYGASRIEGAISIPANWTGRLEGVGYKSRLNLVGAAAGIKAVDPSANSPVRISNLLIYGDETPGQIGLDTFYTTNLTEIGPLWIERCDIGWRMEKMWYVSTRGIFVRACRIGIQGINNNVSEQVNDMTFRDIKVQACETNFDFDFGSVGRVIRFDGCSSELSKKTSMKVRAIGPIEILGMYFESNYTDARAGGPDNLTWDTPADLKLTFTAANQPARVAGGYHKMHNDLVSTANQRCSVYITGNFSCPVLFESVLFACNSSGFIDRWVKVDAAAANMAPVKFIKCAEDGFAKRFYEGPQFADTLLALRNVNTAATSSIDHMLTMVGGGQQDVQAEYELRIYPTTSVSGLAAANLQISNADTAAVLANVTLPTSYTAGAPFIAAISGIAASGITGGVRVHLTIASGATVTALNLYVVRKEIRGR